MKLLEDIELIHTTQLGEERIRRNIKLNNDNVVEWVKEQIVNPNADIIRCGKNWYVTVGGYELVINAQSYTVITAHIAKIKPVLKRSNVKKDVLELIYNRHSYRGKYLNVPVPREELLKIARAGISAPSGCNKQTTSVIVVDNESVLQKLRAVIIPPVGETAPAMICVLTRKIYAYRDKCYSIQDYSAAIENMLLAITSMGYQSCWYEGHITDEDEIGRKMADILGVSEEYKLVCFLPIGIPADKVTSSVNRNFDKRIYLNSFEERGLS